jgi:hypothetical protein
VKDAIAVKEQEQHEMNAECSIWLLPEAAQEEELRKTIAELSPLLGEPPFAPHVTIQGDLSLRAEDLDGSLTRLATMLPLQRWRVKDVECSELFFRCLYLRFVDQSAFPTMQEFAKNLSRTVVGLSPFPHLSLAYGSADDETRRLRDGLARTFAGQEIVFDRIAVCRSSKDVPIDEWQVLREYRFSGK